MGATMFTARQAEKAAAIAVDGVKQLMSSEQAAQDTIAQTHLDFEAYMLQYFTRCFMMGRVIALAPRIDAQRGTSCEEITGDYHFDKLQNLEQMTDMQARMALKEEVPDQYRLRYKQLKAKGLTPWQAYGQVKKEYGEACSHFPRGK